MGYIKEKDYQNQDNFSISDVSMIFLAELSCVHLNLVSEYRLQRDVLYLSDIDMALEKLLYQ